MSEVTVTMTEAQRDFIVGLLKGKYKALNCEMLSTWDRMGEMRDSNRGGSARVMEAVRLDIDDMKKRASDLGNEKDTIGEMLECFGIRPWDL